ncbi:MAG: hypothetical protein LBJ92_02180 [Holosporales bacterium]|jgi:hypothetical protein|nr:hypothetical protein [Holosporales bacterium]
MNYVTKCSHLISQRKYVLDVLSQPFRTRVTGRKYRRRTVVYARDVIPNLINNEPDILVLLTKRIIFCFNNAGF